MSTANVFKVNVETSGLVWDEDLRQRLVNFRERCKWSFDQVSRDMQRFYGRAKDRDNRARNVGMGPSTIYNYASCKWASSKDALDRFEGRLRGWLDHREHGGKEAEIDESVAAAKLIQHGLAQAHESQKFAVIVGQSGMGKSLLMRHFANLRTRGGMVMVEAYDGMTPRAFLAAICRALGEVDTGSKDLLLSRVAGLLAEQPKLLAIDEANFLTEQSINHLVYIWNQANIGIALLGTEELDRVIKSSKLQRVRSRLKLTVSLSGLSDEEIRNRLEESFDKRDVTARVVEIARVGSFASYRDLDTLIETASDALDKNEGKKTLEEVFERISSRSVGSRTAKRR
jgi:DNA transposition AAA+ family ATPase